MSRPRIWFRIGLLWASVIVSCFPLFASGASLLLRTSAFGNGEPIPVRYTCAGDNRSPALTWEGVPPGAQSLALIVNDPDAPSGNFIHWVVFNLPPTATGLPADLPTTPTLANGGVQGSNGTGALGYKGPCPPPGPAHHYHFRLFAADAKLALKPGATAAEVAAALHGHVVAETELVGTFGR